MSEETPCPVCGRSATPAARPFCSTRCRAVDLGRWLGEGYAIGGEPLGDEADEDDPGRR